MRPLQLCAALLMSLLCSAAVAQPDSTWSWSLQTGVMTDGRTAEALNPGRVRFEDSYLLGAVVAYDQQIAESRFTFGAELQLNAHFGEQGFYEIVAPISVRYHPLKSWWDAFDSFAFGFGYSYYSEVSDLERRNYNGTSRRGLLYYYLEIEFAELASGGNIFARLHHRSNGYDLLLPDGGSNALLVGLRHDF